MKKKRFNIRDYYSSKRKRDVVTVSAVGLFILLILFQFYITLIVPIQLKRHGTLLEHIEKDRMMTQIDALRGRINWAVGHYKDDWHNGEASLVKEVADIFAQHIRSHHSFMTPQQVAQLRETMRTYDKICDRWSARRFYIQEEKLDPLPYAKAISRDILQSQKTQK